MIIIVSACVCGVGMGVFTFIHYISNSSRLTTPPAPPLSVAFKVKDLTVFDHI